jgi:hypothetical protein
VFLFLASEELWLNIVWNNLQTDFWCYTWINWWYTTSWNTSVHCKCHFHTANVSEIDFLSNSFTLFFNFKISRISKLWTKYRYKFLFISLPNYYSHLYHFLLINHFNLCVYFPSQIQEIQQLDDGSSCVFSRGQQRFRLVRHWLDVDGIVSLYSWIKEVCCSLKQRKRT